MKSSAAVHPDETALRAFAMSFPEAHEDHPWGESAFKVKGKVFLFVYVHAAGLNASMKLPTSNERALAQPFAEPTGYGLGKSGWVTCKFDAYERVPMDSMKAWITESYRAVAPKKLASALDAGATSTSATKSPVRAEAPERKPRGRTGVDGKGHAKATTRVETTTRSKATRPEATRSKTVRSKTTRSKSAPNKKTTTKDRSRKAT